MLSRRLCPAGRYAPADAPADGRIRARRWYWWMEPGCRNGVACEMPSLLDPRPAVAAATGFHQVRRQHAIVRRRPGKHGLGVLPALGAPGRQPPSHAVKAWLAAVSRWHFVGGATRLANPIEVPMPSKAAGKASRSLDPIDFQRL